MDYYVIRSKRRRKTITLKIDRRGRILIYAPFNIPASEIEGFFRKNTSWLEKKVSEMKINHRSFEDGEEFLYLGKGYPLIYTPKRDTEELDFKNGAFFLREDKKMYAKDMFIKWYRKKAYEILMERVDYFSKLMGVQPNKVSITYATKRYGSCSAKNSICFSWRVVMAPSSVVDYIVVHELCHIIEKNHSKNFWDMVKRFIPDYKEKKLWLKKHAHIMALD